MNEICGRIGKTHDQLMKNTLFKLALLAAHPHVHLVMAYECYWKNLQKSDPTVRDFVNTFR